MTNSVPRRMAETEKRDGEPAADRSRQSIDEWLASAVAEQTRKAEARRAETVERDAATAASSPDRPAAEQDAASAAAGSVASWIERAQQQLAGSARAERVVEDRPDPAAHDAVGDIGDRLDAIERRVERGATRAPFDALRNVERLDTDAAFGRVPPEEDSIRILEGRIREIADKLESPRPIGRRGLSSRAELDAAVAEIRSRQADLDSGRAPPETRPVVEPPSETVSSVQAGPGEPARTADETLEALRDDMHGLQEALGSIARRDDILAVERSVAALSGRLAGTGQENGDAGPALDRLGRDIDVMSHKLDIVAAGGVDTAAFEAVTRELSDLRAVMSGLATPADVAALAEQVADVKADLARLGSLAGGATAENLHHSARDELQPLAAMLETLIGKVERIERSSGDGDILEQIERQVAGLGDVISDRAVHDPHLAALSGAMADLVAEIATWRDGMVHVAERAARTAVAETLGTWRPDAATGPIGRDAGASFLTHDDAARRSDAYGMSATELRGDRRDPRVPSGEAREVPDRAERDAEETLRRINDALRLDVPAEPARPVTAVDSEVLLEPGSERPRAHAPLTMPGEPGMEARDVKASFIAAARRAAQAAAADAEKGGPLRAEPTKPTGASGGRMRSVLDRMRRPLLVSAAAMVVAIGGYRLYQETAPTGSVRPAATGTGGSLPLAQAPVSPGIVAPNLASTVPPAAEPLAMPGPTVVARNDVPDPVTTQSMPAPRDERVMPPVVAEPTPEAAPPASQAAIVPPAATKTETAALPPVDTASRPVSTPPAAPGGRPADGAAAPTAALRQAAAAGDAPALYEMGARTMEGRGVPRDGRAALALFERAAEKNFAPAQYRVGNAYEKGAGVGRDIEAARRWYQRAAENGNTRAMHNLAVLLAEGGGARPDYAAAIGWFQRAAEQGVRDSQFNLAVLFARGLGTSQDLVKSFTWFAIAAAQGDDEAGRKRDEVGAKLAAADLARGKAASERWRVSPASPVANDPPSPATWSAESGARRPAGKA